MADTQQGAKKYMKDLIAPNEKQQKRDTLKALHQTKYKRIRILPIIGRREL
jgi:hypothetical protein